MSSCGWVVASPPWRRGCQVRAPWHRGGHGVVVVVGPVSRERPWRRRSVHRLAKTASRSRFGSFVYTVAMRVASGDTSTPTAMACRQRPSVARLSPGRENRLCASGAAARLAFSLRCQPTQTPEEPAFCTVSFLLLRGFTLLSVRELRKDDRDGTTIGTTGIASGFLTRINEGHSPKEAPPL